MSNRAAIDKCEDLIVALEECNKLGFMAKLRGECFELESAVRICRHEARMADRRHHAEVALAKQRKQDERLRQFRRDP